MNKVYCNGDIKNFAEAGVPLDDIGFLRGYGVFEAIATANRQPIHLADHYERLVRSAARLFITIPFSLAELSSIIANLLETVEATGECKIRVIVTGGRTKDGFTLQIGGAPGVYVLADALEELPHQYYQEGVALSVREYQRSNPEVKSLNYLQSVWCKAEFHQYGGEGFFDVVYQDGDQLRESATSNVMIVKNGAIITPDRSILGGITRKYVLVLARELGFVVEERDVHMDELYAADEVFLTASYKMVLPVVSVGGRVIANGCPGPVSKQLLQEYKELTGL